jgi:hypothetical protein
VSISIRFCTGITTKVANIVKAIGIMKLERK